VVLIEQILIEERKILVLDWVFEACLEYGFDLLKNHGDMMSDAEIKECLEVLTGNGSIVGEEKDKLIDSNQLFNVILGFQEIEKNDM